MSVDTKVLEFKSTNIFSLRLVLKTTDFSEIIKNIHEKMEQSGKLFEGESIVIDAYGIVQPLPWDKLVAVLKQYAIHVIGIYSNDRLRASVIEAGFTPITLNNTRTETKQADPPTPSPPPVAAKQQGKTMLIDRQLRSGERIYAPDSDLIIIGNVGHGAEVIADGNVHVYGSLLGRAIAGAKGDVSARIFSTHLDPSLVAIAGIYRLFDGDFKPDCLKKPSVIALQNETLTFTHIKL